MDNLYLNPIALLELSKQLFNDDQRRGCCCLLRGASILSRWFSQVLLVLLIEHLLCKLADCVSNFKIALENIRVQQLRCRHREKITSIHTLEYQSCIRVLCRRLNFIVHVKSLASNELGFPDVTISSQPLRKSWRLCLCRTCLFSIQLWKSWPLRVRFMLLYYSYRTLDYLTYRLFLKEREPLQFCSILLIQR